MAPSRAESVWCRFAGLDIEVRRTLDRRPNLVPSKYTASQWWQVYLAEIKLVVLPHSVLVGVRVKLCLARSRASKSSAFPWKTAPSENIMITSLSFYLALLVALMNEVVSFAFLISCKTFFPKQTTLLCFFVYGVYLFAKHPSEKSLCIFTVLLCIFFCNGIVSNLYVNPKLFTFIMI